MGTAPGNEQDKNAIQLLEADI